MGKTKITIESYGNTSTLVVNDDIDAHEFLDHLLNLMVLVTYHPGSIKRAVKDKAQSYKKPK